MATPFPEPCGTIYKCGTNGNFTETVAAIPNTSGYAGYSVRVGHEGTTISCCPGAGVNGEIGHATPAKTGIPACYAQTKHPFIEPSGTFVNEQDCRYQP